MDSAWRSEFRARMRSFESRRPPREGEVSISVKVRVVSGCFHREHSPQAYSLIDEHLRSIPPQEVAFAFVEHESGPEVLLYLALATAGVTLTKSVIDLIVAIIKARSEGINKGDRPAEPLDLIVRRMEEDDKFVEERVLRIGRNDRITRLEIERLLGEALDRLLKDRPKKPEKKDPRSAKRSRRKR